MALPQAKQDALTARIAGLSFAEGGWLAVARKSALDRLAAMGLPARRDEYWRYTDPASLNGAEAPLAHRFDASDEAAPFDGMDRVRIVFVDGV
ncbi:MAG: Fe-S cluster assembly protein SufD, partial [Tabrizicola sp.]